MRMKYSKLNQTDAVPTFMPGTIKPICILDDDSSVLNSLQQLLESDGFEARTFDYPDKFLAHAQQHRIKLAVLYFGVPEANGIQLQERLRQLLPNTRIIVITVPDEAALLAATLAVRGCIAL